MPFNYPVQVFYGDQPPQGAGDGWLWINSATGEIQVKTGGAGAGSFKTQRIVTLREGVTVAAPTAPASVATTPGSAGGAAITATGGDGGATTIATTGTGGAGAGFTFTGGAGGTAALAVTAGTGGAGGPFTVTGGAGAASAVTGAGNGTGGAGGAVVLTGGAGGAVTTSTGTNLGGAGGAITITSGAGGAAQDGTDTGGASGAILIRTGAGGNGDTGGASGSITLRTGAVGTGGSPTAGAIIFEIAATEWGRFTSAGIFTVGVAGSRLGKINFAGNTAGAVTVQAAATAGDWTMTLPADDGDAGEQLQTNGSGVTTWEGAGSLPAFKNVLGRVTPAEGLKRVLAAPVYAFRYKDRDPNGPRITTTGDTLTEYVGVMADEAPWAMHHKGRIFNPVNAAGHSFLAIQALVDAIKSAKNLTELKASLA